MTIFHPKQKLFISLSKQQESLHQQQAAGEAKHSAENTINFVGRCRSPRRQCRLWTRAHCSYIRWRRDRLLGRPKQPVGPRRGSSRVAVCRKVVSRKQSGALLTCLGVCIAGSRDDVYLSLGMRSLMLGLDSIDSRRSLARWAFLRLVSGEGGGACSTAVQRSSKYSCRFCRSFSMSTRRVKYGLADTPTTVGAPGGTREEH